MAIETKTLADAQRGETPRANVPHQLAGRYELLYCLGRGGMGEVHAAYDPELDRKVAVKVLRSTSTSEKDCRRLKREGQAIARLNHPNVVKIYDVIRAEDDLYIVMELIDGETLDDWLATGKKSWREVLKIFMTAGRGLAAVHEAGLIHHDFKPSNVMLTSAGEVKVLDFGIALFDEEPTQRKTGSTSSNATRNEGIRFSQRFGTPAYLAPERLSNRPVDHRSDQFSFCIALWEALSGEYPFRATSSPTISSERTPQGPMKPWPRALPSWLGQIVRRGMAWRPEDRFTSMAEALSAIDFELRRRRRGMLATAALALLIGGGLTGHVLSRNNVNELCDGAEQQLDGIWDATRKEQIRTAFLATGEAWTSAAWRGVESTLDRYAAGWLTMKRETCEATHLRGEQSTQVLDLRMLCLDRRRAELRVLSEVLVSADRQMIAEAALMADGLADLSHCRSSLELTELAPLPRDSALQERILQASTAIEEQQARFLLKKTRDLESMRHAIENALRLDYPPLEARALQLQVQLLAEVGDFAGAVRTAEEALSAAIRGGDRILQTQIHGLLVELHGYHLADPAKARWWKQFADAFIESIGERHPEVEFDMHLSLSRLVWSEGDEKSIRLRRAIEIGERLWGKEDARLASPLNNLGMFLTREPSRMEEGITYLERALALREAQLGREHPKLAPILVNLAASHAILGRYEKALALARRSRWLLDHFDPGDTNRALPDILAAQILLKQDRPEDAMELLARAVSAVAESFGEEHGFMAEALVARHDAQLLQHHLDAAGMDLDRVEQIVRNLPSVHPIQLALQEARGRWWLEQKRYGSARQSFVAANELAEALATPPALGRLDILCGLGEADLGLGRPERARQSLEEAVALLEPGVLPLVRARARFALARALPLEERERSRKLATTALRELPGLSPWSRALRQEIRAWLEAAGSKAS